MLQVFLLAKIGTAFTHCEKVCGIFQLDSSRIKKSSVYGQKYAGQVMLKI